MPRHRIQLDWQLACTKSFDTPPDSWIPAAVPGSVQLDWAKARGLPDYTIGDNAKKWEDLETFCWIYRASLKQAPRPEVDQRLYLVLEGVDYQFEVLVDGEVRHQQEGMLTPARIDISDIADADSEVRVRIHPAPKSKVDPAKKREQADESCKPAVAYGWDFHPRLIPLGIWREAYLELRPASHFVAPPEVRYRLSEGNEHVCGELNARLSTPAQEELVLDWTLTAPDGSVAVSATACIPAGGSNCAIPFERQLRPEDLWWPHDQGTPALHASRVALLTSDQRIELDCASRAVGFRRVKLVMAPGEWDEPSRFPKSRSRPPLKLEINGRAVFAKGSNWVCPDVFPSAVTDARYDELLELARHSNFNFLRVWGGAAPPRERFFERCDALGIMVWQEFPLACNLYPDSEAYLKTLDQESRSMIRRLRGHASLVLWCGGNELFNTWSGMTDQSLPLRLLNHNCYQLDRDRPFLPTAPIEGMGHGHYVFFDEENGEEAWAAFQRSDCTAYSEFGCPGPASVATLERILPPADRWPPRPGTAWESHHAFGSWLPDSWLHLSVLDRYFGPSASLQELVERGQLLQGIGFQGIFEEARRQKPTCGMALNWCFTEPWPCAANNSLISWPCEPKPALARVALSCRATLASARVRKFSWKSGELFDPELWLLHDGPEPLESLAIDAVLVVNEQRIPLLSWTTGPIPAARNVRGPRAQILLPDLPSGLFELRLEVKSRSAFDSSYPFIKALPSSKPSTPQPALNF